MPLAQPASRVTQLWLRVDWSGSFFKRENHHPDRRSSLPHSSAIAAEPSYRPHARYPVRRGLSIRSAPLDCWIVRLRGDGGDAAYRSAIPRREMPGFTNASPYPCDAAACHALQSAKLRPATVFVDRIARHRQRRDATRAAPVRAVAAASSSSFRPPCHGTSPSVTRDNVTRYGLKGNGGGESDVITATSHPRARLRSLNCLLTSCRYPTLDPALDHEIESRQDEQGKQRR